MSNSQLEVRRTEFFANVWDHSKDPFQTKFDLRRSLSERETLALNRLVQALGEAPDDDALAAVLLSLILQHGEELLDLLLQLAGLTRNKILTDLRASQQVAELGIRVPSSYRRITDDETFWAVAGPYMAGRLRSVLSPLVTLSIESRSSAFEALNQATYPGFIRQERAKRTGHEAEYRLASVLAGCRIPFQPAEKAINPLCRDVTLHNVSFDLTVPSVQTPRICVKATVHTANIGQYGESKDHLEVDEARRMLDENFSQEKRPILLVLIDGIGFKSNAAGLSGVLEKADEFCQFRTLWKAVVICAHVTGKRLLIELPEVIKSAHSEFLRRYRYEALVVRPGSHPTPKRIPAGDGIVLLDS